MKSRKRAVAFLALALLALALGTAIGSVGIAPAELWAILAHKLFGRALPEGLSKTTVSILWTIRMPRAVMAFLVGASLAASGAVMQSVLRNPLASSYTLGVSSGASLMAAIVLTTGLTLPGLGGYTLPLLAFWVGWARSFWPWACPCASAKIWRTRRSFWWAWCFRCSSTRC